MEKENEGNNLLEYSVEALLLAALRKTMIVRLASVGSMIDQEIILSVSTDMVNDATDVFYDFSKIADRAMEKYEELEEK